jgi:2-dehydro-3-deoxygluconokinase
MGHSTAKGPEREVGRAPQVVCLGETMLMLAPRDHELIEYSDELEVSIGGAETNVAVGLERLGVHSGWIGKLPDNALGRRVIGDIRAQGVDVSGSIWSEAGRIGLFFVERGAYPRPLKTIYDRERSAAATLSAEDVDWHYVGAADWLHVSGITPALSETCRSNFPEIVARARQQGCKVSFDVNYRSLLWPPDEAQSACLEVLPDVSLLIATEADAAMILGERASCREMMQSLFDKGRLEAVVITQGSEGSQGYDGERFYASDGYPVETEVNRLGAGDAFDAGLLYGLITSGLGSGLIYGSAMAALKLTIPQNMPLVDREDVERLVSGRDISLVR